MNTIAVINHTDSHSMFYDIHSHKDERAKPYVYLREAIEAAGFQFHPTFDAAGCQEMAAVLSLSKLNEQILKNLSAVPKERRFLCAMEPPVHIPFFYDSSLKGWFGTIFVMFDDLVDNQTYVKFCHHQGRDRQVAPLAFHEKKLCVMVQSNLHSSHPQELFSERRNVARFSPREGQFDLYGSGWEGFANWRGRRDEDKLDLLRQYRFMICYENMHSQRGYITERIFEALYGSVVPIYLGATNIANYVPQECFIDRRAFSSNEELFQCLAQMDQATHEHFLQAARSYLKSAFMQHHFSPRSFGKHLVSNICKRIGVAL